jgi:hypothetical protein
VLGELVDGLGGEVSEPNYDACLTSWDEERTKLFGKLLNLQKALAEAKAENAALRTQLSKLQSHKGDPCIYCGIAHDDVPPGPCAGTRDDLRARIERMRVAVEEHPHCDPNNRCGHGQEPFNCPEFQKFIDAGTAWGHRCAAEALRKAREE